jgi:N-acylneuraminate cytidylyltransferase
MGQKESIAAFIPLRGGSKSIPLKNIRPLGGRPLAFWTIEAALNCPEIDAVYTATDSDIIAGELAALACPKLKVIGRSPETATDTASTESAMLEFAEKNVFGYIFLIQATSPLLTAADLSAGWKKFRDSGADSLLSVVPQKRFIWRHDGSLVRPVNYDPAARPRRQDFDGFLVENGAFYITSRADLLKHKCRLSGKIACHEMREESYIELDEKSDWKIIEAVLESGK